MERALLPLPSVLADAAEDRVGAEMKTTKTIRAIAEAVDAARGGQTVRIITSKTDAKQLRALMADYRDGVRTGDRWAFGSGSVEIVT